MENREVNKNNDSEGLARIIEFRARNTKAIRAVDIYAGNRNVIVLTGKNRQGKTSILDAIWMALGGKKYIPDIPIRQGEKRAEIFLDLGEFSVTRKIQEGVGEYLQVKGRDGESMPSPQKFLNSRLAGLAHNPLEFLDLKPCDQVKALQKMLNIKLDRPAIEQIAGALLVRSIKGDDPMLLIDNVIKALFEERSDVNREIKRLSGVIESIKIPWEMANIKPISAAELMSERMTLENVKQQNDEIRRQVQKMTADLENIHEKILQRDAEIEILEKKLIALKQSRTALVETMSTLQNQYFEIADRADNLVDPDFTDIDRRISEIDRYNEQANQIAGLKTAMQRSREDHEKSSADTERLSGQIGALNAYKLRLIGQTPLPYPGLGFENGGITYAGIPLDQASSREQIEISCAICLAQHPKIGVLTIDRGWSELDESGKTVLRDCALQAGAQIWVTQVMEEPCQVGFHIVAGELAAVDGVPLAEDLEKDNSEINADGILTLDDQGNIEPIMPATGDPVVGLW